MSISPPSIILVEDDPERLHLLGKEAEFALLENQRVVRLLASPDAEVLRQMGVTDQANAGYPTKTAAALRESIGNEQGDKVIVLDVDLPHIQTFKDFREPPSDTSLQKFWADLTTSDDRNVVFMYSSSHRVYELAELLVDAFNANKERVGYSDQVPGQNPESSKAILKNALNLYWGKPLTDPGVTLLLEQVWLRELSAQCFAHVFESRYPVGCMEWLTSDWLLSSHYSSADDSGPGDINR